MRIISSGSQTQDSLVQIVPRHTEVRVKVHGQPDRSISSPHSGARGISKPKLALPVTLIKELLWIFGGV